MNSVIHLDQLTTLCILMCPLPVDSLLEEFRQTEKRFTDAATMQCGMDARQLGCLWEARTLLQVPVGSAEWRQERRDASFRDLLDIMLCRWAGRHHCGCCCQACEVRCVRHTGRVTVFRMDGIDVIASR